MTQINLSNISILIDPNSGILAGNDDRFVQFWNSKVDSFCKHFGIDFDKRIKSDTVKIAFEGALCYKKVFGEFVYKNDCADHVSISISRDTYPTPNESMEDIRRLNEIVCISLAIEYTDTPLELKWGSLHASMDIMSMTASLIVATKRNETLFSTARNLIYWLTRKQ